MYGCICNRETVEMRDESGKIETRLDWQRTKPRLQSKTCLIYGFSLWESKIRNSFRDDDHTEIMPPIKNSLIGIDPQSRDQTLKLLILRNGNKNIIYKFFFIYISSDRFWFILCTSFYFLEEITECFNAPCI